MATRTRFDRAWIAGLAAGAVLVLAIGSPLCAQSREERRGAASFTAGASLGDGGGAMALTAGLHVALSRRVGVAVEMAHARKLDFTLDVCPAPRVCAIGGEVPVTGRTLALVPQLAIEFLPGSRTLRAYAQAGVGAGHVRQRYFFGPPFTAVLGERTRSNLTLALAFGGGLSRNVSERVAIGADVRWLHLRDDPPTLDAFITPARMLSTIRLGTRVSWRF